MNCPKCLGKLEKQLVGTFEEFPFHIDRCFLCHGIWFDSRNYDYVGVTSKFPIVAPASDDAHHQIRNLTSTTKLRPPVRGATKLLKKFQAFRTTASNLITAWRVMDIGLTEENLSF